MFLTVVATGIYGKIYMLVTTTIEDIMVSISSSASTLSSYIISFAGAAKTAQAIMSTSEDPMVIKEFKFSVSITADWEVNSETEVKLNIWRVNFTQKITTGYKEHLGLDIECTLAPAWVISSGTSE